MGVIVVFSMFLATIFSIVLAYKGFGVWALVTQQVVMSFFNTLFFFLYVRYIPSLMFDIVSFKKQILFGVHLLGANLINTINANIRTSVMGKVFSFQQTGYYTQSNKLYTLPANIITTIVDRVVFPMLSKKDNDEEIKRVVVKLERNVY